MKPYRPNVIAAFTDSKGQFLVCERTGLVGSWQFPQGGIDDGETPQQALFREIEEELGCGDFVVKNEKPEPVTYDFPADMKADIAQNFRGQCQSWFHAEFLAGKGPDLTKGDGEFQDCRWVDLRFVFANIVSWKRASYVEGLQGLGFDLGAIDA